MKNFIIISATALVIFGAIILLHQTALFCNCFSWLNPNSINGSGNVTVEFRDVKNFNKLNSNFIGSLEIQQGTNESLKIESDDNIIPLIQTVVEDDTLKISTRDASFRNTKKLNITVIVKNLNLIKIYGVGKTNIKNLETSFLKLISNGVGSIAIQNLNVQSLDAELSGVGSVSINSGTAENQKIYLSGCGSFNSKNLIGKTGNITVSGCGSAKVNIQHLSCINKGLGSVKNFATTCNIA